MAATSFYKFVNPRGVRPTGGTAKIAGKNYKTKGDGTPRMQVLALNRIGGQLNEQTRILKSIKLSLDKSTKASITNARLANKSIVGLAAEDRKRKINAAKDHRISAREARIRASRARLGARESALGTKPAAEAASGTEDTTPESGGGFFAAIGKFLKTLVLYGALKWLSNPENAKLAVDLVKVLIKLGKIIFKFVEFGVVNALEGFTNIFASDSSLLDRLKGFLQFAVGIFSLFMVNRYLKNPFKLIKDVKRIFSAFRLIPKALGLAAKAGKAVVMATKAGVGRMKGGGLLKGAAGIAAGAAVAWGASELLATRPAADGTLDAAASRGDYKAPTGSQSGGESVLGSFETGGIVPFRRQTGRPSAQGGARIIRGRTSGYRANVGGGAIEAHGTEAVVPIKNRYTDSGNDPLAAILGNSKKMAQGMATLVPMPLKMAGAGILIGLGSLLGKIPFGIGNMLGPIAKTLMGPILQIFGVDPGILDKAMGLSGSDQQAAKDFGEAMTDAIKNWFKSILPGGRPAAAATTPSGTTPSGTTPTGTDPAGTTPTGTSPPGGDPKSVLDLIASVESNGNYDVFNTSRGKTNAKATEKTVSWLAKNAQGAIGRYQHMPRYILDRAKASGFDENTKFTPAVQDKMTIDMLNSGHSMQRWIKGEISNEEFAAKLAPTWRGLPQGPTAAGRLGGTKDSTYNDQYASRNKSHKNWDSAVKALAQIKGQRMFLGGIVKGIGKAISTIAPIAASFIPGIGPLASAAIGGISGMMGGGGIGGAISGALGGIGGFGGLGNMIGGSVGGFMQSAGGLFDSAFGGLMSGNFNMGNILAQGGEMIFGPGFTSMFGGTLDALNIGGKGLGASSFLKQSGRGALDFAVGQLAGTSGGPDSKQAFVPGGSTVLNVNAAKVFSTLMKTQQVAQNSAKIQNLEGATTMLTDKLVKVTSDVIAGVLVEKGKMAELPPALNDQAMAQILPMIQQAIINASQSAQQGGGTPSPGFQKSTSGSSLTSTVAGSLGSIAGKILGGGVK